MSTAVSSPNSAALSAIIADQIEQSGGWIGFDVFMQQALYHPTLGYYSGGHEKIGAGGDFVTAPELGHLFAGCIARQCAEVLALPGCDNIYEFGAGRGTLAVDILRSLETLHALPEQYFIIELSAELNARQREAVDALPAHLAQRVVWLERLPDTLTGCVIANELLDAMPCKRIEIGAGGAVLELGVSAIDGAFGWQVGAALDETVVAGRGLPEIVGYQSELLLQAEGWVRSVGERLDLGLLLLVDYGFDAGTFYHPDRAFGTLMCHHLHRAHPDPFFLPGGQDITTHVDFSGVARAATLAGLAAGGYCDQANFLLNTGLLNALSKLQNDSSVTMQQSLALSAEVKKLIMPHEMGELFKVIGFTRGLDIPLVGFSQRNQFGRLLLDD